MSKLLFKLNNNQYIDLSKLQKAVPSSTYQHPDTLGAGAKKRKKLGSPQDKVEAVMHEFKRGTLHSGSGAKVKDPAQARAIAMSEAGISKKKFMKQDQLSEGTKVESEHKATVDFISAYFKKHGKMPSSKEIYKNIAENHIKGSADEPGLKDYYTRLLAMEENAKNDKKRPEIERKALKFLCDNPNPTDSKLHNFAEKNGIETDKFEEAVYKLATERAMESKSLKKASFKDKIFSILVKAQGTHKYVKRIPNPSPSKGRKWIYFYNQQQVKDYNATGKLPEDQAKKNIQELSEKDEFVDWQRVVPTEKNISDKKASFTGEYHEFGGTGNGKVTYSDGENKATFDANYIKTIQSYFPEAKLYINKIPMSGSVFKVGDEIKAVIMPIRITDKEREASYKNMSDLEAEVKKQQSEKSEQDKFSYSDKTSHGSIDYKNIKNPTEEKIFKDLKVRNAIKDTKGIKPAFDYSKEGQDAGVWTDSHMMIIDKKVADDIYNANKQKLFLENKKRGMSNEEAKAEVEKETVKGTFPNWKQVVPTGNYERVAKPTGRYALNDKKTWQSSNVVEYSDGAETVYLDADRLATIRSKFPDAKMYIPSDRSPVVFKVDGETKAVLMVKIRPENFEKDAKDVGKTEGDKSAVTSPSLQKATTRLMQELEKAKKMPIGTVSNGRKKVAEGKWVPATEGKGKKEKPKFEEKKSESKPGTEKKSKLSDENKTTIRTALKKFANILAEALSGKDVVQPTGQAVEEAGEAARVKKKTTTKKPETKKTEEKSNIPKNKDKNK